MLSRKKINALNAEAMGIERDLRDADVTAHHHYIFARLVEAAALRRLKRSWACKLSDGTTRVDVRRLNEHAQQAARAAKEGK